MRFDVHPTMMKQNRVSPPGRTPPKSTYDRDMYNRAFPVGNALFLFAGGVMRLLRLPRGKFSLDFLAVPAGKDGRVVGEVYLILLELFCNSPFSIVRGLSFHIAKSKNIFIIELVPRCARVLFWDKKREKKL